MHLSLKQSIIYHCKFKYVIEEYSDVLESWIRGIAWFDSILFNNDKENA